MLEISLGQQHELELLIRKAGKHILELWPGKRAGTSHLKIDIKADGSQVTNADHESNQIITEGIHRIFPGTKIVSEEGPLESGQISMQASWVVDPIDGTKYFLEGHEHFRILLGLLEEGRVTLGVMYFPVSDKLYYAQRGKGCYLNHQALRVSSQESFAKSAIFLNHLDPQSPGCAKTISTDTALACIQLCEKTLDAGVVRITEHKTWDLLPYVIMTEECGGLVSDQNGAAAYFDNIAPGMSYLVFSNGLLHPQLLSALQSWLK